MTHLNLSNDKLSGWDDRSDNFLIAVFNKLPTEITAENILQRQYRPWLLRVTEETVAQAGKTFDILDVLIRLQQLRKAGKLRNRATAITTKIGLTDEHDSGEDHGGPYAGSDVGGSPTAS